MVRTIKAGFDIHGAGRGHFCSSHHCTRKTALKTRRNEARQDARRQSDARRQGKDAGAPGKFHGKVHATSGRATVIKRRMGS